MPQSYKTNLRFLPAWLPGLLLFIFCGPDSEARGQANPSQTAHFRVFTAFRYRFSLPETETPAIRKYLEQRQKSQVPVGSAPAFEEIHLTDLYFDTEDQKMLDQGSALRERLFISGDGRRQLVQLILRSQSLSFQRQELEFKPNRRPDKGASFTSHPLLKLIRTKDRPALDSLLHLYGVTSSSLQPVLELNQNQQKFFFRRQGNDWLVATLTQVRTEIPEHVYTELEIAADRKIFSQSSPAARQQLRQATAALARELQQKFPGLTPEFRSDYAKMTELSQEAPAGFAATKILLGLFILGALLVFYILRKRSQQVFPDHWY